MSRSPLRATAPAKAEVPLLKMRKCPVKKGGCGASFRPLRHGQLACLDCAVPVGKWLATSKAKAAHKEDIKQTKAALEKLKRVPELKKEAQKAFNDWVRARDAGKACFVCGRTLVLGGVGGGFDAGHIRSRSNADNLRFDERNVHGQCKPCNAVGATKDWQMREAADRLLGPEVAAELYADNKPIKWQRDQLRQIRDESRAKLAALKKSSR
ncbi:MAG: recombination protein NinG [Roseateles sp.]|uniref:recombination protein NinG n=1 Tax=Roseateles sp. TaxID=1971397 RepID=UPI0040367884